MNTYEIAENNGGEMSGNKSSVIDRFEQAVRAHEMCGAAHPDDHMDIEQEYEDAKRGLTDALSKRETLYDRIATATGVDRESVKKVAHALAYSG